MGDGIGEIITDTHTKPILAVSADTRYPMPVSVSAYFFPSLSFFFFLSPTVFPVWRVMQLNIMHYLAEGLANEVDALQRLQKHIGNRSIVSLALAHLLL